MQFKLLNGNECDLEWMRTETIFHLFLALIHVSTTCTTLTGSLL